MHKHAAAAQRCSASHSAYISGRITCSGDLESRLPIFRMELVTAAFPRVLAFRMANALRIPELRDELQRLGKCTDGRKNELVNRLVESWSAKRFRPAKKQAITHHAGRPPNKPHCGSHAFFTTNVVCVRI
jgi:hypothetical protein